MENLDTLPFAEYKDQLFKRLENVVRYESLTEEEQAQYDRDLKWVMDYNETALYQYDQGMAAGEAKGREEGREQEKWEIAKKMRQEGLEESMISVITGLSIEEIKGLL